MKTKKFKFKLKGEWTEKELKTVARFFRQYHPFLKRWIKATIKGKR